MDDIKFNMYRVAGDIANLTLDKAKDLCHKKYKASYICMFCDTIMSEKLNQSYKKSNKGIALPTCLSINNIVGHRTYTEKDDYQIKEGDIVKIELACHIDNNVATVGDTIRVKDDEWDESDLMVAAKKALEIGLKFINPDTDIYLFEDILKKVATCFDLEIVERPINNYEDDRVLYDWIFRDTDKFNEPSWLIKKEHELVLEDTILDEEEIYINEMFTPGEAYHISVAFTTSDLECKESEETNFIYQKTVNRCNLKSKYARELISKVEQNYDTECFKISNVEMDETKAKMGLKECLEKKVLRVLPVIEARTDRVVYLKCTVIVQNNSVYKLTGPKYNFQTHERLSDELNKIITKSAKFDKREII